MDRRYFLKACINSSLLLGVAGFTSWKIMFDSHDDHLVEQELVTMKTIGKIKLALPDRSSRSMSALDAAILRMDYLVEKLSKFNAVSDIGLINANPHQWIPVSKDTTRLLNWGINLMLVSDGYFDMGMGNFLCIPGLDDTVPPVRQTSISEELPKKNLLKIEGTKIFLERPNTMIDLGGIAKGYILDEMITVLKQHGIKHAAIDLGGDLAVMGGRPDGKPWTIGLDPDAGVRHSEHISFFLREGAVASSGGYRKRALDQHGKIKHHIVDPTSCSSHEYYALATVIGPCATIADALSKVCFNAPPDKQPFLKTRYPDYQLMALQSAVPV